MTNENANEGRRRVRRPARVALTILAALMIGAAGSVLFAMWRTESRGFVVDVPPSHVAVRVNHLTGYRQVVDESGYCFFVPFLHEVYVFDRRPQVFQMEGTHRNIRNHVPYLTVRARDGSNFWFDSLEIQYRMVPSRAADVLADSGPDGAGERWVRAYARSILRDEFGRFGAQEIANMTDSQDAKLESLRRLNELLEPHGIEIVGIITPKPKFDRDYEIAIDERKIANQEVERLGAQIEQLTQERERRLAEIKKDKEIALAGLRGTLEEQRLNAEELEIELRGAADAYATKRVSDGEAGKAELIAQAESERQKLEKEADGLLATVRALESGGDAAVRSALIERLSSIEFSLVPIGKGGDQGAGAVKTAWTGTKGGN